MNNGGPDAIQIYNIILAGLGAVGILWGWHSRHNKTVRHAARKK